METDRLLRAVRRARQLNQRALAGQSGVARATIERIEAGRCVPSLATIERILAATGFRLAVVDADADADADDAPLKLDDKHDAVHDRSGRRFPAHLPWNVITEHDYEHWWAWYRYVPGTGQSRLMPLPPATYHRRLSPTSFTAFILRIRKPAGASGEQGRGVDEEPEGAA